MGQQRRYWGNEQAKDDLYRRYEALQVSEKQVIEPVASGPLNKPVVGGKVLADQVRQFGWGRGRLPQRWPWGWNREQRQAMWQLQCGGAIGTKAEMADAVEAIRQGEQPKPRHKFIGKRRRFQASIVAPTYRVDRQYGKPT